jgi:6-phosphofructokinase
MKKVAISPLGGGCPGMNACIRAKLSVSHMTTVLKYMESTEDKDGMIIAT